MLSKDDLPRIRNSMQNRIGSHVTIQTSRGLQRTVMNDCVLSNTYPDIFTLKVYQNKNSYRKMSYSYVDIMTNAIKLTFDK